MAVLDGPLVGEAGHGVTTKARYENPRFRSHNLDRGNLFLSMNTS